MAVTDHSAATNNMGTGNSFTILLLSDSARHWLILLTVIAVPFVAYVMTAFKGALRRVGFVVLALLFVFFGLTWTLAYAIPASEEGFRHFALKIWLPGAVLAWVIAIAAWAFAIRFVFRAIRVPEKRTVNRHTTSYSATKESGIVSPVMRKKLAKGVFCGAVVAILSLILFMTYLTSGLPHKPQPEEGRVFRLPIASGYATGRERTEYAVSLVGLMGLGLVAALTDYYFDPFDRRNGLTHEQVNSVGSVKG